MSNLNVIDLIDYDKLREDELKESKNFNEIQ